LSDSTRRYASVLESVPEGTLSLVRASPTRGRPRGPGWAANREDTTLAIRCAGEHRPLVDTEGLVIEVKVHSAKVPDQDVLKLLLERRPSSSHTRSTCGRTPAARVGAGGGPRAHRLERGLRAQASRSPRFEIRWRRYGRRSGLKKVTRWITRGSCRCEAFGCCRGGGW
jgi:hypothetical protein